MIALLRREEVIRNLVPPEVATALIAKTARGHHNYSAGAFGVAKRGAGQTARRSIALEDGAFRKTVAARVRNMNEARTPTHSADGNDMFSMRRGAGAAAAPARLGRKSVSSSPPIGQSGNPSGATGVSRKSRLSVTNGLMGSGPDRPAAMTQSHNVSSWSICGTHRLPHRSTCRRMPRGPQSFAVGGCLIFFS